MFDYIHSGLSPHSELGKSARRMCNRFNESKKLKRELSESDRLKLVEVTIRETSKEEVIRRMEKLKIYGGNKV